MSLAEEDSVKPDPLEFKTPAAEKDEIDSKLDNASKHMDTIVEEDEPVVEEDNDSSYKGLSDREWSAKAESQRHHLDDLDRKEHEIA
jgi:hypothetical protein